MSESNQIPKLKTSSFLALYDQIDPDTQTNEIIPQIMEKRYVYLVVEPVQPRNRIINPEFVTEEMIRGVFLSYERVFEEIINIDIGVCTYIGNFEYIEELEKLKNTTNDDEIQKELESVSLMIIKKEIK